MLYKKSLSLGLFFLLGISFLHAQKTTTYWDVDFAYGSVLKHKKSLGHLATAHPELYTISWFTTAPKDNWKQKYNYPDWGLTLLHQEFNNPILGNVTALNYSNTFYLLNRNNTNQLNLGMGLGFGYSTMPLDFETNNQNIAISSPISFSVHLKANYEHPNLFRNIGFSTGFLLTHYSNSSYKKPNSGINSIFLNVGLSYRPILQENNLYPSKTAATKIKKQPISIDLSLEGAIHELRARLGAKPVLVFGATAHKRVSQKSSLTLGVAYFHSWANKDLADFIYHTNTENVNRKLKDFKQIGISIGHELLFDQWIFNNSVGYYAYNPLKETPSVYQKLGFKYRINHSKFSVGFVIKVHNFKADYTSLGVHYQIFKQKN